jgi:prepilin-type N-terminal cleavage/methylation domain-containing protein
MNRKAFTLVELLVVISIIGLLVVMLLPAVQSARESGRRAQCQNNLKQLGIALSAYHSTNRNFPAAMTMPVSTTSPENPTTTYKWGPNWVISILPNLDEQALYSSFNPLSLSNINSTSFLPISGPDPTNQNPTARATQVKVMLCPSDIHNRTAYNPPSDRATEGPNWARGNYGANGSIQVLGTNPNGAISNDWTMYYFRGVMGCNTAVPIDQIRDGTTCTVLLGELRSGLSPTDNRGVWAMGAVGASCLWGHGVASDQGPNNNSIPGGDRIAVGVDLSSSPGIGYLTAQRMGCVSGSANVQATARSMHQGGVFVCFCDGSVHFLNDAIARNQSGTVSVSTLNTDLQVWERLMVSSDGLPLDPSTY